ncbi:MAG: hypothetical protein AAF488_18545, partial [Planctomycetota bacterium]
RAPFHSDSAMNIIVSHITEEPVPLSHYAFGVDVRLCSVIHRMMQKSPLDRYQDYQQLLEAIAKIGANSPTGTTSTQIENARGRIVLISEATDDLAPTNSMGLKQLSIADVNLELGRHDKALGLYHKVLEENPHLTVELGFRILKIHQQRGDHDEASEWTKRILEATQCPKERFYCRWKLLTSQLDRFGSAADDLAATLQDVVDEEAPPEINSKRLRQRLKDVSEVRRKLSRERETGLLLIRKSGDLPIELD